MMEGFFMKYIWSAAGSLMIAIPAFFFEKKPLSTANINDLVSTRTQDFIISKKLLQNGAEAIERIMLAFKEVNEFAGYTSRVYDMLHVFEQVQSGNYVKTMVGSKSLANPNGKKKSF